MPRRIPPAAPILALALHGCGPAARPTVIETPIEQPAVVMSSGTTSEIRLTTDNRPVEETLPAHVDTVWRRLPAAWEALRIPIVDVVAPRAALRSERYRAPSSVAGRPLREFVDCGYSAAGPRASLWDVYLEVTTAIRRDGEFTRVSSIVTGYARPRDGSGTPPVPCASTGRLERLITTHVLRGQT